MALNTICVRILLGSLLASGAAYALAGNAEAGKAHYTTCAACHGAAGEGKPALNGPAIAGQSASYLERQLLNFRSGARGTAEGDTYGAQMRPMAMMLADDAAVADVAAYIASLPATDAAPATTGDTVAGGKQFQSKCGACHGSSGQGNEALKTPRLTGLSFDYLIRQVEHFQKGLRGSTPGDKYGMQMKMMATTVNDKQLKDVAAYLNSKAD